MAALTVVKNGRHWAIQADGKPLLDRNGRYETHQFIKTRRAAFELIADMEAAERYEERVLDQDRTGVYVWNAEEESQIGAYAEALKTNPDKWTLELGRVPLREASLAQHRRERKVVEGPKENWIDSESLFAEKRRTMAARVEAWKRAGLDTAKLAEVG